MIERRIKELAIALEALSRIQGYEATQHFNNVSDMLNDLIKSEKEKPEPESEPKPPIGPPPWTRVLNPDDEIPF